MMSLRINTSLWHYSRVGVDMDLGYGTLSVTQAQLCPQTKQIRRILIKGTTVADSNFRKIKTYIVYQYNAEGQIVHYKSQRFWGNDKEIWEIHLRYEKQELVGYKDSMGNCWEHSWQVPMPFAHSLEKILQLEADIQEEAKNQEEFIRPTFIDVSWRHL